MGEREVCVCVIVLQMYNHTIYIYICHHRNIVKTKDNNLISGFSLSALVMKKEEEKVLDARGL